MKPLFVDAHIHIGQYNDIYETPKELTNYLSEVGVTHFAVSSSTICEENYDKVINEMREVTALAGNKALPVMWITPGSLYNGGVRKFLDSGIEWKCVKIHPWLSPNGWREGSKEREQSIELARELQVPLLIHTGETEGAYPLCFDESIGQNPDVQFILAHGRPVDEAIDLMKKYKNAWVDTAFMPTPNIVKCCEAGFVERVLWGSDYPIPKYYYKGEDMKAYYARILDELKQSVSQEDFTKITQTNALCIFKGIM